MRKLFLIAVLCLFPSLARAGVPSASVAPSVSLASVADPAPAPVAFGIFDPKAWSGAVRVQRVWYGTDLSPGVSVGFSLARPLGKVVSFVAATDHDWTNGENRWVVGASLRVFQHGKVFGQ